MKGIVIEPEQVEKMQKALSKVYATRYRNSADEDDEFYRGYSMALADVMDLLGIEHEKWNPLRQLNPFGEQ